MVHHVTLGPLCYPRSTMFTRGPSPPWCYPGSRWEDGEMVAQENPPEIPVGAIAHHCAQVPGSHWWYTLVCVCGTHWSEVVHQGVQHPHCVVRGSLSSHSRAPHSKLELPLVINSASTPSFFLSCSCSTLFQNSVTSASDCFIRFIKNKHFPIFHCLFFFLGRSRILPCFSSPDT